MRTINIETGKMKSIIHSKWHAHNHNNRITMIMFADGSITAYPMSPTTAMHITKEHNELEPDSMGSVWLGDIYDFNISDEDLKAWIAERIQKAVFCESWELFFDGIPYTVRRAVLNCTRGEKRMVKLSEEAKKRKSQYDVQRKKKAETNIMLHFVNGRDDDVIDALKNCPNKIEYINRLVREDLERQKKNQD